MHDDNFYFIIFAILFLGVGVSVGCLITYYSSTDIIGQMVCNEKGLGDFVSFDSLTKTITCKPIETKIQYDGGYIKIQGVE
jgi:hypothetical protein